MMPYIPEMKAVIAPILGLETMDISIKAKTKEQLDAVGAELAIEAQAVVMLEKSVMYNLSYFVHRRVNG